MQAWIVYIFIMFTNFKNNGIYFNFISLFFRTTFSHDASVHRNFYMFENCSRLLEKWIEIENVHHCFLLMMRKFFENFKKMYFVFYQSHTENLSKNEQHILMILTMERFLK